MQIYNRKMVSPFGTLTLMSNNQSLIELCFREQEEKNGFFSDKENKNHPLLIETERQITAYFEGRLHSFDLPLSLNNGSVFQQQVWAALAQISLGETCSYGQLAAKIGRNKAVRAVGAALGKNPFPIILPCHRVIGSTGHLTGFTGGLSIKRFLLDHEQAMKTR